MVTKLNVWTAAAAVGISVAGCAAQTTATGRCDNAHGRIAVSYSGVWPNSCIPGGATVMVNQGLVELHATQSGEFCLEVLTPFSITAESGPLCDGEYRTLTVLHRFDGSVAQSIAGPGVRINCSIGDFNNDCAVSVQDIFDFLIAYFGGDPRADVNGANGVTVQDVFDYLIAYFGGG